jgi:NADH:ubiquinone oxidoreductase subunit 6 (subunit J)
MGMQIAFWIFTSITLGGAVFALLARDVVRSAFALFGTFLGIAGLYLTLGADFLAMTQVLIYAGGIMVLYLFGIMLSKPSKFERNLKRIGTALVLVGGFAGLFLWKLFGHTHWNAVPAEQLPTAEPTSREIGLAFLRKDGWLFAFEFVSIILLTTLVGAVYIARRRGEPRAEEEQS